MFSTLNHPDRQAESGHPVMVFIHGDDYLFGGLEDFPPLPLLNHPVVLVVLQYRLGVLGKSVEEKGSGPARGVRNRTLFWRQIPFF